CCSQSANTIKSAFIVPNRRVSSCVLPCSLTSAHAAMVALCISNPQQRSYITRIFILLLRHPAEDVESVDSPSRVPRVPGSQFQHCPKHSPRQTIRGTTNVLIQLICGLAVATAAPSRDDLHAARWCRLKLPNSSPVSGFLFHDSWCRQDMKN